MFESIAVNGRLAFFFAANRDQMTMRTQKKLLSEIKGGKMVKGDKVKDER